MNNKISNEKINLIKSLYDSWNLLEEEINSEDFDLFTKINEIKNNANKDVSIYCNDIGEDVKTILIYNKKEKNYTISMLNKTELCYIFDNKTSGITLLKDFNIIQENLLFQQLSVENSSILFDVKENKMIKNILEKNFKDIGLINLNKENITTNILEDNCVEVENVDPILANTNIKMLINEDINPITEKQEPFISKIPKIEIIQKNEEVLEYQKDWSFNKTIKKLTGLSLEDNSHQGYSEEDKLVLTIDDYEEEAFEKTIMALLLLSEDFNSNINEVELINNFFKTNIENTDLLSIFLIRNNIIIKEEKINYILSEKNRNIFSKYMNKLENHIFIVIEKINSKENLFGVNLLGDKYTVVENKEILNSSFFVKYADLKNINKEDYIDKSKIIGGNIYLKKEDNEKSIVNIKNMKNNFFDNDLLINNKSFKLAEIVDLENKDFIVSEKHKYVFDNIQDLLLGYLANEELHYKSEDRVEDKYLETLIELKNSYLNEVGELNKNEKSWKNSNKNKRYFKFAISLKEKLLKFK